VARWYCDKAAQREKDRVPRNESNKKTARISLLSAGKGGCDTGLKRKPGDKGGLAEGAFQCDFLECCYAGLVYL
jgi:hypothetical protein